MILVQEGIKPSRFWTHLLMFDVTYRRLPTGSTQLSRFIFRQIFLFSFAPYK